MAIIDNYDKEELEQIVKQSYSYKQVIQKLGYMSRSGSNQKTVKNRIEKYNIDTSHFKSNFRQERNEENIFIKDSTASQQTLRRWYKKEEYTPYVCSICQQEPFWQGKELTLILDHINGICNDDRLENLRWVCPNCNQQLETTGYKKMRAEQKISKKYFCKDCGKEISRNAIRCVDCNNKAAAISLENMPVTREELKKLIKEKPFTEIGKQFGVTDNAIKKWCDKFNLPRRKKDINSYSAEEWEKI